MLEWRRLVASVLSVVGVLGVLVLSGCSSTPVSAGPSAPPRGQQAQEEQPAYNPDGFNLAIVTDISGSMRTADPRGFNREGAQLAVALASVDDNLALVAFNNEVDKVFPMTSMKGSPAGRVLSRTIDTLSNSGGTNFIKALQESNRQLAYLTTSGLTAVIFLSDGKHETLSEHPRVLEISRQIGGDQRRIFTIALGDETDESLLQQMANLSGGNSYRARRADDLVDAYLKILGDFYNLFTYDADYREITVGQSAKRLIYLLIKNDGHPGASLEGAIQHDGSPASPSAAVYRRPPSAEATFDVMQFDSDLPGTWTCDLDPALGEVVLLSELPTTFRILADNPGSEYSEGVNVPYALEASCGTAKLAAYTAQTTTVTVQRWAGDTAGQVVTLRGEQQGDLVLFRGSEFVAQLHPGDDEAPELQTARFEINLSDQGWTHTKETSLLIHHAVTPPTNPVKFSGTGLSGAQGAQTLSLGQFWAHQPVQFERSLELQNTSTYDVYYEFSVSGGLVVAPAPLALDAGTSATVIIAQANAKPGAGRHGGALLVKGRFTDPDDKEYHVNDTSIALDLIVHAVTAGPAEPSSVAPGWSGTVTFPIDMAVNGTTMSPAEMSVLENSLDGLEVSWPGSFTDRLTLAVAVPPLTQAGRYEATFRPNPNISGMNPGPAITIGFDVGGSKPKVEVQAPTTLNISSASTADADGWVEFPGGLDVVMDHHGPLDLSAAMAHLVNAEDEALRLSKVDLRMVPKKVTLQPRAHQQLALKVNVGNLPPPGTYSGMVTLRFRSPGERDILETAELKVTVVVEESH